MGIRKNAKFLTAAEREAFVRACVLLKAHIVNPAAPADQRYSKWDEYVAVHRMIQNAFAPGTPNVNFGHGGSGAYSFLSWHRYFLYRLELDLQSKVAGVMLPYWDWSDPATLMTDTFMGPNGTVSNEVRSGYFAADAPGTGTNPTPAPAWWPAGLTGWRLPSAFGMSAGPLKRAIGAVASLPPSGNMSQTLAKSTYADFQLALESGAGLIGATAMHNGMHTWFGMVSHMRDALVSAFDPIFFLHHANVDRLWAMWQCDGHATDYPAAGGKPAHHRNDPMYPWVGATPGYGTTSPIASAIPMPDFSALGVQRNVDTLDHRAAYGYTYDTIAIIGLGLDRTGSMLGLTPDPMTVAAPDVTKWEAAKRGVSAFLQDCETVQASATIYTVVGIKTFRQLGANEFQSVFAGPGYGLVKTGSGFSRATFDSAVAAMTPGGGTPLADALLDVKNTLVSAPFGGLPADDRRYLAMLTDGLLTAGAPMNSIPNGSFAPTAVFAMGFGTGLDVDYPTLQSMVDKGRALSTTQVFHGETAGTIDKFYSNALAAAIGFSAVFDPVLELFAGEHTHIDFNATSADEHFLITAQGMDFDDANWSFQLHAPDGSMLYSDASSAAHEGAHGAGCGHCCRLPRVTARRGAGRLSLVLDRDGADAACWVGTWQLMASYRARHLDAMAMFSIDSLMTPVAAGTLRGPKYARLLVPPKARTPQRSLPSTARHALDAVPPGTNRNDEPACDLVVNIYARTRLRHALVLDKPLPAAGESVSVQLQADVLQGRAVQGRAFARMVSPLTDIAALAPVLNPKQIDPDTLDRERNVPVFDAALALANAERRDPKISAHADDQMKVAVHGEGPPHVHIAATPVPGPYHLSVYMEGEYFPGDTAVAGGGHEHGAAHGQGGEAPSPKPGVVGEPFSRLLTTLVPVGPACAPPAPKKKRGAKKG
ncbi:tyrosinase family protein [Ideonella sp. BN130291]|uniref:tyrosinase family protein n=1 Tax=Ideonella sp. BN130291 TaxID=3112940 RepID=UPI002E252B97|nr:tyrosinase family protein [Ideonella sp. BN130291]